MNALSIFRAARARLETHKGTAKDELIVALWEESIEQDERIRAMAIRIERLESKPATGFSFSGYMESLKA